MHEDSAVKIYRTHPIRFNCVLNILPEINSIVWQQDPSQDYPHTCPATVLLETLHSSLVKMMFINPVILVFSTVRSNEVALMRHRFHSEKILKK